MAYDGNSEKREQKNDGTCKGTRGVGKKQGKGLPKGNEKAHIDLSEGKNWGGGTS